MLSFSAHRRMVLNLTTGKVPDFSEGGITVAWAVLALHQLPLRRLSPLERRHPDGVPLK